MISFSFFSVCVFRFFVAMMMNKRARMMSHATAPTATTTIEHKQACWQRLSTALITHISRFLEPFCAYNLSRVSQVTYALSRLPTFWCTHFVDPTIECDKKRYLPTVPEWMRPRYGASSFVLHFLSLECRRADASGEKVWRAPIPPPD